MSHSELIYELKINIIFAQLFEKPQITEVKGMLIMKVLKEYLETHLFGENENKLLELTINIFVLNTVHNSAPYVSSARNIRVLFDQQMTLVEHVILGIQPKETVSQKDTEIFVHALISPKLDVSNSLLYGLPKSLVDCLQAVQNCSAHLVTCSRKHGHITPILTVTLASCVQLHQIQDTSVKL